VASLASPILDDIVVLEVGRGTAISFCGKLLGALGAEVIKVEPAGGDPARNEPPFVRSRANAGSSIPFLYLNTAKRSVVLDSSADDDRSQFWGLVSRSDLVLESPGDGSLGSWGMGAGAVIRSGCVVLSIEPFGHGPYESFLMTELVAQAVGGILHRTGTVAEGPVRIGGSPALYTAGGAAFSAALAALVQRDRTKIAQSVEVSVQEVTAATQMVGSIGATWQGSNPERTPPEVLQKAADGWVSSGLSHVGGSPETWQLVCDLLGRPDLKDDPRFANSEGRKQNREVIDGIFEDWLGSQPKETVYHRLQALRAVAGFVATPADLYKSRQLGERGYFHEVVHPEVGPARYPGLPFRIGDAEAVYGPAPCLGEALPATVGARGVGQDSTARRTPLPYALDGIRVLDLTQIAVGPYVTFYLGNLGAEVIKVESNRRPDGIRGPIHPGPGQKKSYPGGDPGLRPWNRVGTFNQRNRGKLGITLDFSDPAGRKVLERLIASSDVLVENFRASVMERQGLDWPALKSLNPRLVYLKLSSQGNSGPERDYGSVGPTLEQTGGLAAITGQVGGQPSMSNQAYLDPVGAIFGVGTVLAGIRQALRTGAGQFIDFSQRELAVTLIGETMLDYEYNRRFDGPLGNRSDKAAPQGVYRCLAPDSWIAISIENDDQWRALATLVGSESPLSDQALASEEARRKNQDQIDGWINQWTAGYEHRELMSLCQANGIPAGAVLDSMELLQDPHLESRGWWDDLKPTEVETVHRFTGAPWRLSASPYRPSTPAPTLGEHNDKVFRDILGLDEPEYEALKQAGTISIEPLWERN
jgi:crotonobetainyl-CoA:carnitine CoA-transferase CaiB-like acyl-CoA transferase